MSRQFAFSMGECSTGSAQGNTTMLQRIAFKRVLTTFAYSIVATKRYSRPELDNQGWQLEKDLCWMVW